MGGASNFRTLSECFIKPNQTIEESNKPFYLGSSELMQLSQCHLQIGLLFRELPSKDDGVRTMDSFSEKFKQSLSSTLVHFYPLAGRFVTEIDKDKHESFIFIDCNKGPEAKFIHVTLDDVTVNDRVSPAYVPITLVQSFFQLGNIPTNYDGHEEPLLVVQVTELVDDVFFGVSINGSSFWHFFSSWSEMFRSNNTTISRPPNYDRWFPDEYGPIIKIPHTHPEELITRYTIKNDDPPLREVIFHFSINSIENIKARAHEGCVEGNKISSFQALSALIWRSIIRSHCISDESSTCVFVVNARSRINPPLSKNYFGSFVGGSFNVIKVSELLEKNLGSVASIFYQAIQDFNDQYVRDQFIQWIKSPIFYLVTNSYQKLILISGSHREDAFDIEFGLGKAMALRRGSNMYDGKVVFRPAREGKGSVNVEICLSPDTMAALQQDNEIVFFFS